MDLEDLRLYWVDVVKNAIQYYDFEHAEVLTVPLKQPFQPTTVVIYHGSIYYANQADTAIHVADKTTGDNDRILRNSTGKTLQTLFLCKVIIFRFRKHSVTENLRPDHPDRRQFVLSEQRQLLPPVPADICHSEGL